MEMNKKTYLEMLNKMDWYFQYSDDMRVWSAGQMAMDELVKIANSNPLLLKMYNDYTGYVFFEGPVENRPKKPEVSDYE